MFYIDEYCVINKCILNKSFDGYTNGHTCIIMYMYIINTKYIHFFCILLSI